MLKFNWSFNKKGIFDVLALKPQILPFFTYCLTKPKKHILGVSLWCNG